MRVRCVKASWLTGWGQGTARPTHCASVRSRIRHIRHTENRVIIGWVAGQMGDTVGSDLLLVEFRAPPPSNLKTPRISSLRGVDWWEMLVRKTMHCSALYTGFVYTCGQQNRNSQCAIVQSDFYNKKRHSCDMWHFKIISGHTNRNTHIY